MKILHIDSSITGDQSVSRQLTARIVKRLNQAAPATTSYRDLAKEPLPHLTFTPEAAGPHAASLREFLEADVVVVGAPMYNFAIPSQLKAWIDSIAVAGKTFRYSESGPEGLATGKRVIVASSRGGVYSDGPMAALDHQETYLRQVFGFLGIADVEFVRAEGVSRGPDSRQRAIGRALAQADVFGTPETIAA
ncbi:MAG TPA: FMN-dependent NADH-azoreductase [Candidatus Acidoferrales bacterium]|nr:FMN-dependent NADH-azoreductase [Candidatus Acidoferrales bacterium]